MPEGGGSVPLAPMDVVRVAVAGPAGFWGCGFCGLGRRHPGALETPFFSSLHLSSVTAWIGKGSLF